MGKIMKDGISYSGSTYTGGTDIEITGANVINAKVRELTQAQYDALSSAEKNNGTTYYITDGIPSVIGVTDVTDGNTSIVTNHVADVSHKVNKSGDTMTGDLNIDAAAPNVQIDTSSVTIDTTSDNHVTANTASGIEVRDSNDYYYGRLRTQATTDGAVTTYISARNRKTDGIAVINSINATVNKDGTRSYTVSDPAAFRSAIGLNGTFYHDVKIASGTLNAYTGGNDIFGLPTPSASANRYILLGWNSTLGQDMIICKFSSGQISCSKKVNQNDQVYIQGFIF